MLCVYLDRPKSKMRQKPTMTRLHEWRFRHAARGSGSIDPNFPGFISLKNVSRADGCWSIGSVRMRSRVLPPPEPPSQGPRLHLSRRSLRCREDEQASGRGRCTGGFNHGQVIMETKIATGHFEV